jgi:uncharacterized membrane protein YdjX (TVP38/TMEM64 family)
MSDNPLPHRDQNHRPGSLNRKLAVLAIVFASLVILAVAWSWSPMRNWLDVAHVVGKLQELGHSFGPAAAIGGFALAVALAVPLIFLTLVAIVAFGPWLGFAYSMGGALVGATISFGVGRHLGHDVVQRLGGEGINRASQRLAKQGILAIIAVRMVPIAPFAIVNMVAGASHLRLRDLLIGTAVGMTPGTLGMVMFVDQIIDALQRPNQLTAWLGLMLIALIFLGFLGLRKWLS